MEAKPVVRDLDTHLKVLVNWERFGIHLPGIEPYHTEAIRRERQTTYDLQKIALYDKWLTVCPTASWGNVIKALEEIDENRIANDLKNIMTGSSVIPIFSLLIDGEVVEKLEIFKKNFDKLERKLQDEIKDEVKRNGMPTFFAKTKSLNDYVRYTRQQKAFPVVLVGIHNVDEFLEAISSHYDFLNCDLIILLAEFMKGLIESEAIAYRDELVHFMKSSLVKYLCGQLRPYHKGFHTNGKCRVALILQRHWGDATAWLVKRLVQFIFRCDESQCHWFNITIAFIFFCYIYATG